MWPRLLERGRRLGVDVGSVRIGVAICDPDGLIATPLVTLPASTALDGVAELVHEYEVVEIIVGLPRHLSGDEGASAQLARDFAHQLGEKVDQAITLVDERLSTKGASAQLSMSGISTREQKGMIDQLAAATILQLYLDASR